jgi:excisionase family DNA binding protein
VKLWTASDVARFCGVDHKTVHNWTARGKLRHHRTEGRHLRFRRLDLIEFLRRYGYAVPDELREDRPRVLMMDGDPAVRRALRRFDVVSMPDPLDLLLSLAQVEPEVLVLDHRAPFDLLHCVRRLGETWPHLRTLVIVADDAQKNVLLKAGASEVLREGEPLKDALEQLTGLRGTP